MDRKIVQNQAEMVSETLPEINNSFSLLITLCSFMQMMIAKYQNKRTKFFQLTVVYDLWN